MGLQVTIDKTGNAAFSNDDGTPSEEAYRTELARILRDLAKRIEAGHTDRIPLHDYNGNRVGHADLSIDIDEDEEA